MVTIGTPKSATATKVVLCGSGELGKEFVIELQRYGVEVIALDKYPDAPAMQVAHRSYVVSMLDGDALREIIEKEKPDYIVPEVEAIATRTLMELEEEGYHVIPTARATWLTMNREGIRRLAAEELGLPTSPYRFAETEEEFKEAVKVIGMPCVVKPIMCSVLIGALLNIVLDPIFIFWLDMGVKGAALATILSQACSAIWVLSFLFSRRASLPLERRYMRLDRRIVLSMFALGISPFIMASTESLVGFVLNSSLKNFGDIYVSALAILQSAMQFASVPLTGFAQGFVPIISYNYGHGDKQRVKDCFRIVLIVMFSFNLILMLFMILFPSTVASAFTSDEELIDTVRWVMPIFLAGMTIFGLQRACQNMFVALGQAKISIFIALLRKVILLIPLALLLPHFMGVTGVYAAEAVSDATAAICCTLLFIWKFPKKKEERAAQ